MFISILCFLFAAAFWALFGEVVEEDLFSARANAVATGQSRRTVELLLWGYASQTTAVASETTFQGRRGEVNRGGSVTVPAGGTLKEWGFAAQKIWPTYWRCTVGFDAAGRVTGVHVGALTVG
ncbi:MAG: hypothetical protein QM765_35890 [Myxococcales bacterium]